jgi:hypothetical protein
MSLAIAGIAASGRVRAAYPGPGYVLPQADPRAIGLASPPPEQPPPSGADLSTLSESVRDRVTLSARVRQSAIVEKPARRRQPFAQPAPEDASRSLSEMADAVADRVTLTRRNEPSGAPGTTYTSRGVRLAESAEAPSPELDRMAAGVTDQVTLAGDGRDEARQPEITVYIAGNRPGVPERPPAGGFGGMSIVPSMG